jgi:hypothetical protein
VRRINIIADKTLLFAYTQDRHTLTVNDIRQAARDSNFKPARPKVMWIGLTGLIVCLIAAAFCIGIMTEQASETPAAVVELVN